MSLTPASSVNSSKFETFSTSSNKETEKPQSIAHSDSVTQSVVAELIPQIGSSSSSSSSSFSVTSSSTTMGTRISPREIGVLLLTTPPMAVLKILNSTGYPAIGECHCIPALSRENTIDVRDRIETELPRMIAKKFPNTDQSLQVCTIGSGKAFQDLVWLSKLRSYVNIIWTLVDSLYDTEDGQATLAQFKELAKGICPTVKIQNLGSLEEIPKAGLQADVYFSFDVGDMRSTTASLAKFATFKKYIYSSPKPIIHLDGTKELHAYDFDPKAHHIIEKAQVKVTASFISSDKDPETTVLFDDILPGNPVEKLSKSIYKNILCLNNYEAAKYCLLNGADPELRDSSGYPVLAVAAEIGRLNTVRALVEIGRANVNAKTKNDTTVLSVAIQSDSRELITYLVKNGASINGTDKNKSTALHQAAGLGKMIAIDTLVSLRARTDLKDNHRWTPLQCFKDFQKKNPNKYTASSIAKIEKLLQPKKTENKKKHG